VQKKVYPQMQNYGHYLLELKNLLYKDPITNSQTITEALNGQAYSALRSLVPLSTLRSSGAFFTGHEIAEQLADLAKEEIQLGSPFIDPTCGAGNLLVAAAKHLPLGNSLPSTLSLWSEIIHGIDIHPEFIEVTKLRLILLAKQRGNFVSHHPAIDTIFQNIRCTDALSARAFPSIVLINPPYHGMEAPDSCKWSKGLVSSAAVFLDHVVQNTPPSGHIYALLPEVLRCGSRYQSFREVLGKRVLIVSEKTLGIFDRWTDIDVFSTELQVLGNSSHTEALPAFFQMVKAVETVEDRYRIHVGPLVDYRSPETGLENPYVEAVQATPWDRNFICTATRKFDGTVFRPPFVVIRRTSRPGDKFRAIGTVIRGDAPVAVENHLLVALPKRGTVKECIELMKILRQQGTNDFLNATMRCRHLTVGAVKNIPWIMS